MRHVTLTAALLAASCQPAHALDLTPDYAFIQGMVTQQSNTHNDDELEASSEALPALSVGAGWNLNAYFAAELRASWRNQRAHGCNEDECGVKKATIDGAFNAVALQVGGLARYPNAYVTPYARAAAGPAYSWADTTRALPGGQRGDRNGVVLSYEGAVGLERTITQGVSTRVELGHASADPIEQQFLGVALVYSWR